MNSYYFRFNVCKNVRQDCIQKKVDIENFQAPLKERTDKTTAQLKD